MNPAERPRPQLVGLRIADPPALWEALGFTVDEGRLELDGITIALGPADPAKPPGPADPAKPPRAADPAKPPRAADPAKPGRPADSAQQADPGHDSTGILSWALSGVPDHTTEIDGLPTTVVPVRAKAATPTPTAHENGAIGVDHVVVLTPDFERSTARLEAVGMLLRRIREVPGGKGGAPLRQGFRRLGPAILELVETPGAGSGSVGSARFGSTGPTRSGSTGPAGSGSAPPAGDASDPDGRDGPARFWGLVIVVSDLDALSVRLGDRVGTAKRAVQPGRRIVTLRTNAGLSAQIAFMDPEPA